jgi:hypothetical protein
VKKYALSISILLFSFFGTTIELEAGTLTVHVGPASVGSGGSNPISIPPTNPLDYEFIWLTDNDFESNYAVSPGFLFGNRTRMESLYVSLGGGLVIDANGTGPGIYSSLGYNTTGNAGFNAEFKQALGFDFGTETVLAPYAVRIGGFYKF